jgi:hypothetical protein
MRTSERCSDGGSYRDRKMQKKKKKRVLAKMMVFEVNP